MAAFNFAVAAVHAGRTAGVGADGFDGRGTVVDSGHGVVVDGVPFELQPGQAHLVFPQSYHSFSVLEKNEIVWMMVSRRSILFLTLT